MKIFDLLDGRDNESGGRQRLFCLARLPYYVINGIGYCLTKDVICKVIDLASKYKVNVRLSYNSNLMNPLFFDLDGYAIYHLGKNPELAKNWGNEKQFLLDLINDLNFGIKVSFSDEESGTKMYVLGKDGEIVKEYISEEIDV